MTFFELHDQFFQLNNQQPIPALASKLYMYWLNEFNRARWPAVLYRRANQVYADLPCDKNTFGRAVAQLEERGLLHFDTASRGWELNYGPASDWLPAMVNNSPNPTVPVVNNSPQSAQDMVNNSPQDVTKPAETLHLMVKNSPPIRNRPDVKEDQPKKKAGVAAEEITLAPLPAKNSQLVPPVAEPPHAAESRPVAAAELSEALAAEAKALANEIAPIWDLSEIKHQPKWARIHCFTRCMARLGRLPEVKQQLAGYRAGHLRPGVRPHQLDKWLGSAADDYAGGEWCGCDWPGVAAKVQARPGDAASLVATATTSSPTKVRQQKSW